MTANQDPAKLFADAEARAAAGRAAEAAPLYRQVLVAVPGHLAARRGLARALAALGRDDEARAAEDEAVRLDAANLCTVGRAAMVHGKLDAAMSCFERALALKPDLPDAVWDLAEAWYGKGKTARALEGFRRFLALRPGNAEALHTVAALGGAPPPDRASEAYLSSLFDRYAGDFDRSLIEDLDYRAPELLFEAVSAALPGAAALDVVDLGCGTGLAGVRFRAIALSLVGVDVSSGMLDRARARGIYDALERAELAAFLAARPGLFDLAVAADSFCYIGDLVPVFRAAAGALRPGGILAFTVEWRRGRGWKLTGSGRYAHNPAWLRRAASESGFVELSGREATLRLEYGKPVAGYVSLMRRPSTREG